MRCLGGEGVGIGIKSYDPRGVVVAIIFGIELNIFPDFAGEEIDGVFGFLVGMQG